MKNNFNIKIALLMLIFATSCTTESNLSFESNCASIVYGKKDKLVCGDSKDRILEKWGQPTNVSFNQDVWQFQNPKSCLLFFSQGKLIRYGSECPLKKISNDSFFHEKNTEIALMNISSLTKCTHFKEGDRDIKVFSEFGLPESFHVHKSVFPCLDHQGIGFQEFSCDTVASYTWSKGKSVDRYEPCQIFFKNARVAHLSANCPISCK